MASTATHYDNFTYGNSGWNAPAYGTMTLTAMRTSATNVQVTISGYMSVSYTESGAFQFEYEVGGVWTMYSERSHTGGTHYAFSAVKNYTISPSATSITLHTDFTIENSYGTVYGWNRDPENITLTFDAYGLAHIDNGSSFDSYSIYIDNGTSFDQYVPYIDDGTNWNICT